MTFSRWCAAGNEYLLAERAELGAPLTPEGVRAEVGGSDGILEVVAVAGREAEVVIWNPDGSTAELSGNGTRIVARWLADRSGAEDVTVRVGDRTVAGRLLPDGEIEQDIGTVEVYERERVAGLQVIPVSVGNPHAVVVGDPDDLPLIGPLLETHPRFPGAHERAGRAGRLPGSRDRAGLGTWRRGDPLVGNERGRGRGGDAR